MPYTLEQALGHPCVANERRDMERTSEKFLTIPTHSLLRPLYDAGFSVGGIYEPLRNNGTGRHMVRIHHPSMDGVSRIGQLRIELHNSADGTSALRLITSILRLVCMNGLVAAVPGASFGIPHRGKTDMVDQVIDRVRQLADNARNVSDVCEAMQGVTLDPDRAARLALDAYKLRYTQEDVDEWTFAHKERVASELLKPVRAPDESPDLWTVFNVIQEKLVRGQTVVNGKRLRGLKAMDASLRVNKGLFALAYDALNETA